LDKLLVADEEGDLLTEDKPAAVPKAASDSAALGQASANADGRQSEAGESVNAADSAGATGTQTSVISRRGPPPPRTAEYFNADAVVEDGRTINFAQNLKEYRSPRLAMLLSLLLPGLGQAYSRSYIKASAFGAAEIAAIGVAVYLNSVAKSKKKEAYNYAEKYFDIRRIVDYDSLLRDEITIRREQDSLPPIPRDSIPLPYDKEFFRVAGSKSAYYYETIRDRDFTPGWTDYDLSLESVLSKNESDTIDGKYGSRYVFYNYNNDDWFYYLKRIVDNAGKLVSSGEPVLGYSSYQIEFNARMNRSNSYRDAVNYVLYAIVLNHIASAVDAGFTARAYNARLLGEDNSAWNRLSVEQQFVFTGSEHSPGVALRLRF
jgi:hypothetical protein